MRCLVLLLFLLFICQLYCQIDFYIETDETNYSYGQDICITFNLHNTTANTIYVVFYDIFPFSYFIDDEYFSLSSMPGIYEVIMLPNSTYSENYIHTENVSNGDHDLTGEFNYYLLSDPVSITVGQVKIESVVLKPVNFELSNYPNPFNPSTEIRFQISDFREIENAEIIIYNIKGRKMKQLVSDQLSAGQHSIIWNGDDESGNPLSSGIYFYQLNVNGKTEAVKKCLLLK